MYLSRIMLDLSRKETMKALATPSHFHGAIENADFDSRSRKLWRLDKFAGSECLLILSEECLDFSLTAKQFGYSENGETKNYDAFLENITEGSQWHFRLCANPSFRKLGQGRIIAHIGKDYQHQWLTEHAPKNGFILDEYCVTNTKWYSFRKGREQNHVKILAVTYEGILTVENVVLFRHALTHGIGRGKAYGMGLLTITRK